jgi:hypothetical protein
MDSPLYTQASIKTADNLRTIAQRSQLSLPAVERLTLPELEAVVDQVARLVPAGNVPGMILSGLARLPERRPPVKTIKRDLEMLFRGVEQTLDRAVYTTFFAGPAAVIGAYHHLLKLAGKDPAETFPEGVWQFYVEYAMREDTARHTNETCGFDAALKQLQLSLSQVDRLTAWVMAAVQCLNQYTELLANEWRERVSTHLLAQITQSEPNAGRYARLYRDWEPQRPYGRESRQPYPAFRRQKFQEFLAAATSNLPPHLATAWQQAIDQAEAELLPAYQQQLSILAYLNPGPYSETRTPIPLAQACIGLIYQDSYFLIPACLPGSERPTDLATVRGMVAAALNSKSGEPLEPTPSSALSLAQVKRTAWPDLRRKLSQATLQQFDRLRLAPILINADPHPCRLPLAHLRQAERGLGDHALTLFDTGETMIFDQSHIFFDGAWGAALAEIMTQEALYWANQLTTVTRPAAIATPPALVFTFSQADQAALAAAPRLVPEASAETAAINMANIRKLRRLFKQRSDLLRLTVNDLLILYRAIHVAAYQPDPALQQELEVLTATNSTRPAAIAALEVLRSPQPNPAMVIPVDASQHSPADRLHPITFEAPLAELNLLELHQQTVAARSAYHLSGSEPDFDRFDQARREYLAALAGFGELLNRVKEIAGAGQSLSVGALKLLAHFPPSVQRLLEQVPAQFDVLNDLLKGREVFSNVGAVVPASSLTRFISAKDDNDKKTLVWGIITNAQGEMHISLRDFRPHVGLLAACGHKDLANRLTWHYLETYAAGLNDFVAELYQIAQPTQVTRLRKI